MPVWTYAWLVGKLSVYASISPILTFLPCLDIHPYTSPYLPPTHLPFSYSPMVWFAFLRSRSLLLLFMPSGTRWDLGTQRRRARKVSALHTRFCALGVNWFIAVDGRYQLVLRKKRFFRETLPDIHTAYNTHFARGGAFACTPHINLSVSMVPSKPFNVPGQWTCWRNM